VVFKSSTFLEAAQAFGGAPARAASPADRRYEASPRGLGHHRNGFSGAVQLKQWGSVIEIMFVLGCGEMLHLDPASGISRGWTHRT